MRGDIVLYKSNGVWYEQMIVKVTQGPYVHVGIDYGDGKVLAALSSGIAFSAYSPSPMTTDISLVPEHVKPEGIEAGMLWATAQEGKHYGWVDILYQAVKFLAPNNPFQLVEKDHFDCSDFVSRYLGICGFQFPKDFQDPYANTPNDIARIFGLIPMRENMKHKKNTGTP